jgi:spoIIIJ-associated protein
MEWVETTGKTVEEAKDAALDQLGVDEQDAEFEVLEEPRTGLFGRTRGEARVRARVRPTQARPKVERRDRRGRSGRSGRSGDGRRRPSGGGGDRSAKPAAAATATAAAVVDAPEAPAASAADPGSADGSGAPRRRRRRGGSGRRPAEAGANDHDEQESRTMSDTELAEQGEVVRGFLVDLVDAFGLDGEVTATPVADDDAVELAVAGDDLGLLIGPKGATLQAVQELSRSVLQRSRPGEVHARVRVDVGGYRARRREALEAFVRKVAAEVVETGTQKALEPMAPPDRKVVHDTVNDIPGVHTVSEGEDARRRVVLIPDT